MMSLHGSLMKFAVLANCKTQNYFVLEDKEAVNGSRLVGKEEYSNTMLGFASYIADNCPQLFSAIPLYHHYLSSPVTVDIVKEFLGQSLSVATMSPSTTEDGVYSRQTIVINEDMKAELAYSYSKPIECKICYKDKTQEVINIRSLSELCDIIQRYSGEVVTIED